MTSRLRWRFIQLPHQHQLFPEGRARVPRLRLAPPSGSCLFLALPISSQCLLFVASIPRCLHRSFLYSSPLWPLLWLTACFSPVSRPLQEKPDLLRLFQACTSIYYHIFSEPKTLSIIRLVSSEVPPKKEKLLVIEPLNLDYKMCPNSQMLKCV